MREAKRSRFLPRPIANDRNRCERRLDVALIESIADASEPETELLQVLVYHALGWSGLEAIPEAVHHRHGRHAAAEIAQLESVEIAVRRAPVFPPGTKAQFALQRSGNLRSDIELLFEH